MWHWPLTFPFSLAIGFGSALKALFNVRFLRRYVALLGAGWGAGALVSSFCFPFISGLVIVSGKWVRIQLFSLLPLAR